MNINWKVRAKNPLFWFQLFLSIVVPVGAYFGLTGQDITSWPILLDVTLNALSNPYVLFIVGVSVFNALNDPTTKGVADSNLAMRYKEPKGRG
ncbi:phage holin [Bacillus badius]|uniref:Phage holin n=1 Tax=Bacillus badius TaxID=1455 RepID=A0ABR5AXZ5_BACBA|nr:phage holin [Bacillus badius]KIL79609.1 Phage holin [Bacillus badius]MED4716304.1 phage holin [Bacillus badius]